VGARRILGVDAGGTGIKLGAVEIGETGRIVASDEIRGHADRDREEVLDEVAEKLRALLEKAGWDEAEGVGAGCAGLVNRDRGIVQFSPNLPKWENFALGEALGDRLGLPARVDNDVNTFSLAEWRWGAGERLPHVTFLTLGTGIGGGFIVNGELVRGAAGFAGEPGHATLILDGIECTCGNRGCAERYVGNRDIVKAAERHPGFDRDPILSGADPLTPEVLTEAAHRGSRVAWEVMENVGHALGGLLVTLVNIFNPQRVVIGGGVAQAGALLFDPARAHLMRRSLVARQSPPEILPAGLGTDAGLLGSAALLLEDSTTTTR
jgi:glucokinase